jgi:hypothetical protein
MTSPKPRLQLGGRQTLIAAPAATRPQVLCYDAARRLHHVLYLDGEHEWLDLTREAAVWVRAPLPGGAVSAGVIPGARGGRGARAGPAPSLHAPRAEQRGRHGVRVVPARRGKRAALQPRSRARPPAPAGAPLPRPTPLFAGPRSPPPTAAAADIPKGRAAVGWRVAVYWRDDRTFYEGQIMSYDAPSGCHR